MSGVLGLVTAAAILLINRRRPYSPWVLLGLLPMGISAPWILAQPAAPTESLRHASGGLPSVLADLVEVSR